MFSPTIVTRALRTVVRQRVSIPRQLPRVNFAQLRTFASETALPDLTAPAADSTAPVADSTAPAAQSDGSVQDAAVSEKPGTKRRLPPKSPRQARSRASSPKKILNTPEDWQIPDDFELVDGSGKFQLSHPELNDPLWIPRTWLRDACVCDKCIDPSSGQKRFSTYDIPVYPSITDTRKTEDGSLEVTWKEDFFTKDDHVSVYPLEKVQAIFTGVPGDSLDTTNEPFRLWNAAELEELAPFFDYDAFMEGGSDYYTAFRRLLSHGIFFLRGIPQDETAVERIAQKLGILQETFYGRTWDVVSKPDAENIAYTSSSLGLHSDLLYVRDPPKIQLLHCLKNSCEGGESTFSDGLRASQQLRLADRKAWDRLRQFKVRYWYTQGIHQRSHSQTVISRFGLNIYWSPQFQRPEQYLRKDMPGLNYYEHWVQSARNFKELLEAEGSTYQYKMQEGECAVFDNLRTMHGRQAFDTSTGERWLKGTYVGSESFRDKVRENKPHLEVEAQPDLWEQVKKYNKTEEEESPSS